MTLNTAKTAGSIPAGQYWSITKLATWFNHYFAPVYILCVFLCTFRSAVEPISVVLFDCIMIGALRRSWQQTKHRTLRLILMSTYRPAAEKQSGAALTSLCLTTHKGCCFSLCWLRHFPFAHISMCTYKHRLRERARRKSQGWGDSLKWGNANSLVLCYTHTHLFFGLPTKSSLESKQQ